MSQIVAGVNNMGHAKIQPVLISSSKWQRDNVEPAVTLLYNKELHGVAHRMAVTITMGT